MITKDCMYRLSGNTFIIDSESFWQPEKIAIGELYKQIDGKLKKTKSRKHTICVVLSKDEDGFIKIRGL